MDANQMLEEERAYTEEELRVANFLIKESEKNKIGFYFGHTKNNGYMNIDTLSNNEIVFNVYDRNIDGQEIIKPRKVKIDKDIVENELCRIIDAAFSEEELTEYLLDFNTGELYFNTSGEMKNTYNEILKQTESIILSDENCTFFKNLPLEGMGCLYVDDEPVSLIESLCVHRIYKDEEFSCLLSADLFSKLDKEGDRYLVFFPTGKQKGYLIKYLTVITDQDTEFDAKFNVVKLHSSVPPEIVDKCNYPLFNRRFQKIKNNNFLDLYIEDPYEQREELFKKLIEEKKVG